MSSSDEAKELDPATIQTFAEAASYQLSYEDRRSESLNTRAGALAGFAGVTISVAGVLGTNAVNKELGNVQCLVGWLLVGGVASLALGIMCAVCALKPREILSVSDAEIKRYESWEFATMPLPHARGSTLRGYVAAVVDHRRFNRAKVRWLSWGYGLLSLGVGAVSVGVATIVLRKAGAV